jgi:alkylation response protein AidB-like acyl-CoA dehydrogenase
MVERLSAEQAGLRERARRLAREVIAPRAAEVFGAACYSRNNALERRVRDARMFTIGGGTAQILRTVIASRLLGRKLPQTRDGCLNLPHAAR